MLVYLHNRRLVSTTVAVVGCYQVCQSAINWQCTNKLTRKDGHHVSILRPTVALHDQLMRPSNQRESIVVIERFGNVLPKRVSGTSGRYSPSTSVIRVRPEKIAHRPLVRHFLNSIERADIIQRVDTWRKATVEAEYLVLDQRRKWEVVEEIGKVLPNAGVAVFAETLVVETVDLCDLAGLMVSTQDSDALGIADLECDKQSDGLNGEVSTINIVTYGSD